MTNPEFPYLTLGEASAALGISDVGAARNYPRAREAVTPGTPHQE